MLDDSWSEGLRIVQDPHHQVVTLRCEERDDWFVHQKDLLKAWVWDDTDEAAAYDPRYVDILGLRIPAAIYPVGAKIRVTLDYERPKDKDDE